MAKQFSYNTADFERKLARVMEPHRTATTKADAAICNPILSPFTFSNTGSSAGASADEPVGTVRTAGGQILAAANLIQYHTEQTENVRSSSLADPLQTVEERALKIAATVLEVTAFAADRENADDSMLTVKYAGSAFAPG